MPDSIQVNLPDRRPRYLRLLLPLWLFSAFLTGVKFVPGMANNFGPFEIVGLLVVGAFAFIEKQGRETYRHALLGIVTAMLVLAVISQVRIPARQLPFSAVQVVILAFFLLFLVSIRHFVDRYQISPETLLTITTISVLIVGPWVYFDGISSGSIQAAGPFRNRAHMANYMLTAFWIVAMHIQWPRVRPTLRYAAYAAAGMALYAIAASGRRSVYLSLFLGLSLWVASSLVANRGRIRIIVSALLVIGVLFGIYRYASFFGPQGEFFQQRVGTVDDRLRRFTSSGEEEVNEGFYQLQRSGVMHAFRTSPVIGIGWGGFPNSLYSPTGHEVHSTPLRFLAELGSVGFAVYVLFIGYLLLTSVRLFFRMRSTPYGSTYLILTLATWSMTVSHVYNRHITERTFWIFVSIFLSLEIFSRNWYHLQKLANQGKLTRVMQHREKSRETGSHQTNPDLQTV